MNLHECVTNRPTSKSHFIMCVQYRGGYHELINEGISLSTVGDITSTVGDIMMHVGNIVSTVEGVQYHRVYNLLLFEYPHGTEHPHGTHDIHSHVS